MTWMLIAIVVVLIVAAECKYHHITCINDYISDVI